MIKHMMESLEHVPPRVLKKMLKGCLWEGTPDSCALALTFDDGPDPEITPAVLDVLDEIGGHATFFLRGDKVREYPDVAENISQRGHTIGNHSMGHRKLFLMRKKDVEYEVNEAQKAICDATGCNPIWFRPPHGLYDGTCADVVKKGGMSIVLWTVLSGDYDDVSPEHILHTVKPFIRPGAILVFHDTIHGGGTALPGIIRNVGDAAESDGIRITGIEGLSISYSMKVAAEK